MKMDNISKDDRFKHISSDPRFRSVAKQQRKVKIDDRFRSMFNDKQFKVKYSVDKRGRPISHTTNENLKKYYELSSSEDENEEAAADSSKAKIANVERNVVDDSDEENDVDDNKVDYARGEGNVETSSDEDSSSDEDDDNQEKELIHAWGEIGTAATTEEITHRLAVCHIDWDRISAQDIYYLCKSFTPPGGIIKSVKIYLSEFGRQRLALEEIKGPAELTETGGCDVDDDEELDDDAEGKKYHIEKLRQYQLNRLNYYYAVVECDSAETAAKVYDECDGTEFESSATKLDLRYIPNDMEFDGEPHSFADVTLDVSSYRPKYFTTTALQSSKVKLTWDETNPNRIDVIQRAFNNDEQEDMDVNVYLASSSDEEDSVEKSNSSESEAERKGGISKYKSLLQEIEKKEEENKNKNVHLEITWGPGLKERAESIVKNKIKETEASTPWEQYLKNKREKKKQKAEKKQQTQANEENEENPYSDDEIPSDIDLNDEYFQEELDSVKHPVKKGKNKLRSPTVSSPQITDEKKAELSLLLMDEDDGDQKKHFNLRKLIENAEGKKKKKKKSDKNDEVEEDDDFQMNLNDERFGAIYTSHLYNIDPSEPNFKNTKGIQQVMEEKQKRRMNSHDNDEHVNKKQAIENEESDVMTLGAKSKEKVELSSLVKSIKSKTKNFNRRVKKTSK